MSTQHTQEMRQGARTGRAEVGLAGVGLAPGQKVGDILHRGRHGGADGKTKVKHRPQRDRHHIDQWVVLQLFVDMRVNAQHGHGGLQNGGAISGHGLHKLHRNLATGTGLVLDHRILGVARRAQPLGHAAANGVGRAAGRKAGDDAQGLHALGMGAMACAKKQCRGTEGVDSLAT
jgi:hypothetical protein